MTETKNTKALVQTNTTARRQNFIYIGVLCIIIGAAFLIVLPLFYAHMTAGGGTTFWRRLLDKRLITALILTVVVFFLTTPYMIMDYETFKKDMQFEAQHYGTGHLGAESSAVSYRQYLGHLSDGFGVIPLLTALAGCMLLLLTDRKQWVLVILFPVLFYLFIGRYPVHFSRNALALIPFLAILCGFPAGRITALLKYRHKPGTVGKLVLPGLIVFLVGCALGVYGQLVISHAHITGITLPDTRWAATLWINENLPPGSKIGIEHYTPRPDQKKFKISGLGTCGLIKPDSDLQRFDYVVASSDDYDRFFQNKTKYREQVIRYRDIFTTFLLVKQFQMEKGKVTGPVIKILGVVKKQDNQGRLPNAIQ